MTVTARDVAAAVRERLPDLPVAKLHALLYYAQGHHLAETGAPLFPDAMLARESGPVVDPAAGTRDGDSTLLDEAALNTVGYVVSRYGALSAGELGRLARGEAPWRGADGGAIGHDALRLAFTAAAAVEAADAGWPDVSTVADFLALSQRPGEADRASTDDRSRLLSRAADHAAGPTSR